MTTKILPSRNAWRNSDELVAAALARLDDNNIGPFDSVDEALTALLEPKIGDGYGRPVAKRRAGR